MHKLQLETPTTNLLAPEQEPQMQEISNRIALLRSCDLDPFEREILSMLERPIGNCAKIL
ncbi:MAG: hypothetical protein CLLPBCKN_006154 [Chroococcidiopsis cubana SAG 39.79]|uniref:hypothetical protein n=1 Tax=Chroococcidiopsis cubana TaxID=171392 RepID=UPI000D05FF85|nr:hypothetical protein [Chroococcidiopsis cubana]MDZ4876719.1 hypothetical protein [Chroococcidiopsis cubana SAG 39.79]PSB53651.1 hypothetical protein C7B79_35420 [Chroococcidiopsis cubana CCALA 043]